MRAVVLYHFKSDHAGKVEDFIRDFKRFKNKDLERLSLETVEGSELAKLYDIVRYPAIMIIGPQGKLERFWQGENLPLMDEVSAYLSQ